MKVEIELDLPQHLADEALRTALRQEAVLRLFAERRIPAGQATRLLGLTRLQFLALLDRRDIPHIDYTHSDWDADTEAIEEFRRQGGA